VQAHFARDEPTVLDRWLEPLRKFHLMKPAKDDHTVLAVIDLKSASVVYRHSEQSRLSFFKCYPSPDGRSLVINYQLASANPTVECWDVPPRTPWLWMIGIPALVGGAVWIVKRYRAHNLRSRLR
jgi:hypothetical protein